MAIDLATVRRAWRERQPDAIEQFRTATAGRREERGDHGDWARLAEEMGEHRFALTEYQLALRDDPDDVDVLGRLAVLYEEMGDLTRATECAERRWRLAGGADAFLAYVRLLADSEAMETAKTIIGEGERAGLSPAVVAGARASLAPVRDEAEEEPAEVPGLLPFSESDVVRFAHLFAGRENVYARQWCSERGEAGYSPVREPFTIREARNHLLGTTTVGIYVVRLDNTVTFCAVDVDITKRAIAAARGSVTESRRLKELAGREAIRLHGRLAELGLPALVEDSGYKGRHLWLFLEEPEAAAVVRQFGSLFLARFPVASADLHAEFFPKQPSAASGIGNLIKLPLGIHRKSGRRSRLLRPDGTPDADPFGTLRRQARIARETLHAAIIRLKTVSVSVEASGAAARERTEEGEGQGLEPVVVPAPPQAPPAWTAADFETNSEISHLLASCAVLRAIKQKVDAHRRLNHDERIVLVHSLGHSGVGVLAVNYLLDQCVDTPPGVRLQTPLSGNPISCPKIRKRIPHVTAAVACHCAFEFAADQYPSPRLHLLTLRPAAGGGDAQPGPAREAPAWDPVDRARALGVLWAKRERLAAEIAELEQDLMAWMERTGADGIDTGDGTLRVHQEQGAPPALRWEPRSAPAGSAAALVPVADQSPSGGAPASEEGR